MSQTDSPDSDREQSESESHQALIRLLQLAACWVVRKIKSQNEHKNGNEGQKETNVIE